MKGQPNENELIKVKTPLKDFIKNVSGSLVIFALLGLLLPCLGFIFFVERMTEKTRSKEGVQE